jgi:hypothetical protein
MSTCARAGRWNGQICAHVLLYNVRLLLLEKISIFVLGRKKKAPKKYLFLYSCRVGQIRALVFLVAGALQCSGHISTVELGTVL